MNPQQSRPLLYFAASAIVFAVLAIPFASAEPIKIVVPDRLAGLEGESSIDVSNFGSFRQQKLHLASEFASVPEMHRTITGFYARPDYTVTQPGSASYADLVIKVSTTPAAGLSSVFADNYGAEVTTVFDGPLTISTQATGDPLGPRGFDYYFPFDTPYSYASDAGNLLVEMASNSGPAGSLLFDGYSGGPASYVGANGANASAGVVNSGGFANQFDFVPEPSSCLLTMLGIAGLPWVIRRRRCG